MEGERTELKAEDRQWVSEALHGLAPTKMDKREWIPLGSGEHNGTPVTRYRMTGRNVVVLLSVTPVVLRKSSQFSEKRVSYHVTIAKVDGDRVSTPNESEIAAARRTFFKRDLRPEERKHEGRMGDSKAHHIVALVEWNGASKLANPSGGLY